VVKKLTNKLIEQRHKTDIQNARNNYKYA